VGTLIFVDKNNAERTYSGRLALALIKSRIKAMITEDPYNKNKNLTKKLNLQVLNNKNV
jgi:hypothetical protein